MSDTSLSDVKILNLSSANLLELVGCSIEKLNLNYELAWDSTDVIGRMNPIKNYKNTKKTRSITIKVTNMEESNICYFLDTNDMPKTIGRMLELFKQPTLGIYKRQTLDNILNTQAYINKFFFPSYLRENVAGDTDDSNKYNYFMKSAPLFLFEFKSGNLLISTYCIISSFKFSVNGSDFGNDKVIDKFQLDFEIEEIMSDISQASSIVVLK